jgi:PIN domain nuclease of toxin-antitoxin system
MRLLLDTNVLTWLHHRPERLGKRTKARISDATIVYYSPLSFFEWLQRDDFQGINAKLLIEATKSLGFSELPVSAGAAQEAARFGPLRNRDPLDALILAQASYQSLDFYTSDQRILDLRLSFVKDSTL